LLSAKQVRDTLLAAGATDVVRRIDTTTRTAPAIFDRQDALAAAMEVAVQREVLTEDQLRLVAATGVAHAGGVTDDVEAAITLTAGALRAQCIPARLPGGDDVWVPGPVMDAARTVQESLAAIRTTAVTQRTGLRGVSVAGLTPGQRLVAEAVAAGLPVVVEGPAGTGKTTALRRALAARNAAGLITVAVAPSRVAVTQLGDGWTTATTAHGLLVAAGWTQDGGLWTAPPDGADAEDAALREAVIVVDEAGMLDLHTLAALTTHARVNGARVILVGDDRQLAPVGVAGGFALAKAGSDVVALTEAKRFTDPAHAALAACWRTGTDLDAIAGDVLAAGLVRVHATEEDAQVALAETAAANRNAVVMVADNATAVIVNRLTRAEHQHTGHVGPATGRLGRLGEDIGIGDLVQTRSNDRHLGVINRQRWTVTTIDPDGAMTLTRADQDPHAPAPIMVRLDAGYVAAHVHRADAVTVHAAQGATADEGHALLDGTWTREQAYVALTRGRTRTVLHVVADDHDDAHGLLTRILASSDTARAAALVAVTTQSAHEARVDVTPGIVDRIEAGLRRMSQRVGAWGTTSAIATATAPPAAPTTTIEPPGMGL
ncbi:MAG: AAA family ATPase, partial [Actinobacteria bacterium]|nr:AAA family ATPase [Actinomycetota bacterium]